MLESEIVGGVAGRSTTYLTHHDHVDDQNSRRHDHADHNKDIINDISSSELITSNVDSFSRQCEQRQADNDFLRSGSGTEHLCLYDTRTLQLSTPRAKK